MSTLTVGTISEKVTDAGINIDGATLKDGGATFTSDVTIGDGTEADKKILFDGNAQDFHIGLDDSNDSLTIGLGSTLGTTSHMIIDANGHVTKPLQPAFLAFISSSTTNVTVNSTVDITFATETFDQNSDYNSSNGVFTAPTTGKYFFTSSIRFDEADATADYHLYTLETSNRKYRFIRDPNLGSDTDFFSLTLTTLADMDAGDTAKMSVYISSSASAQADITGTEYTYFSGYLVA